MEVINRVVIFNKNTKKTVHLGTFKKAVHAVRLVMEYATNNDWFIGEDSKGRIYGQPSEHDDSRRVMIWRESVCESYADYVQSFTADDNGGSQSDVESEQDG